MTLPAHQPSRRLVILTSTFPRWKGDATPSFVADFAQVMAPSVRDVMVIAPHAPRAERRETWGLVHVRRFRYVVPERLEDIAYEGGAVGKVRRSPAYLLKLAAFLVSLTVHTFVQAVQHKGAVLNAHWLIPQGFIAVLVKVVTRRPVVVTVHGGDVFTLRHPFFRSIKRFVLARADAVVTNSSATRRACAAIHPGRDYPVIPMGVDLDQRFMEGSADPRLSSALGINGFTALFVGRLSEEKGAIYLCQAVERLASDGDPVHALVIGDGPERPVLERFVADHGLGRHVHLLGWKQHDELAAYYRLADVFVGPSVRHTSGWEEAFGLVFLEALATGTPVVGTQTGGIADLIRDGVNGYLVPQRDPVAIADRLRQLRDDPETLRRLAEAARGTAQAFSWDACATRYARLFADLSPRP